MLVPAKKEITALTKLEGDLKVAKLPEHMQGQNPIGIAKTKLNKLIQDIEFHNDDNVNQNEDVKLKLDKAVQDSANIRKMMRPFC